MVQTAALGAWWVAVPADWVVAVCADDAPQWLGPGGQALVLHDDGAVPVHDLAARWGEQRGANGVVLLLQPSPQHAVSGLRVGAIGARMSLPFWTLPAEVTARCGVRAAALVGAPWRPQRVVLLLDAVWLQAGEVA
jgi:hypothetical protein